ncbi:MAG TPA: TetR/AcrR family transcriptional regulator [Candidatus Saccharimonadia bacterium]|nr:TetR/AcrR family transcriptional regulator [Candidatus Saccharimonadia bacterium]
MQPEINSDNQDSNRSFIEQARRTQIIDATVAVLAEYGYVNTSFARIGKQAGISASLISYHFKDKDELTTAVLKTISRDRAEHVQAEVAKATTATDRLRTALEADLAHMGTRPQRFQATVEVIFGLRGNKGALAYLGDHNDPSFTLVHDILVAGQKSGEFGQFDATNLAIILDAARDTFLAQLPLRPSFNLEQFTKTLVAFALDAVRKDRHA